MGQGLGGGEQKGRKWGGGKSICNTVNNKKKCLDCPRSPSADQSVDILSIDMSVMLMGPIVLLKRQGNCFWCGVTANWITAWKKGQHS